jgi:hypothetical protein
MLGLPRDSTKRNLLNRGALIVSSRVSSSLTDRNSSINNLDQTFQSSLPFDLNYRSMDLTLYRFVSEAVQDSSPDGEVVVGRNPGEGTGLGL